MQPTHAAVLCDNSGVLVTQFQKDLDMNFSVFLDYPRKKTIFVCKPQLEILFFFLAFNFLAKLYDFFLMPVVVLGGIFREKKGINHSGVGLEKKFKVSL